MTSENETKSHQNYERSHPFSVFYFGRRLQDCFTRALGFSVLHGDVKAEFPPEIEQEHAIGIYYAQLRMKIP